MSGGGIYSAGHTREHGARKKRGRDDHGSSTYAPREISVAHFLGKFGGRRTEIANEEWAEITREI